MKKVWNIYQDSYLIGIANNTYNAINRVEIELGRKLSTKDGQDTIEKGYIKGGNIEAKYESPKI